MPVHQTKAELEAEERRKAAAEEQAKSDKAAEKAEVKADAAAVRAETEANKVDPKTGKKLKGIEGVPAYKFSTETARKTREAMRKFGEPGVDQRPCIICCLDEQIGNLVECCVRPMEGQAVSTAPVAPRPLTQQAVAQGSDPEVGKAAEELRLTSAQLRQAVSENDLRNQPRLQGLPGLACSPDVVLNKVIQSQLDMLDALMSIHNEKPVPA